MRRAREQAGPKAQLDPRLWVGRPEPIWSLSPTHRHAPRRQRCVSFAPTVTPGRNAACAQEILHKCVLNEFQILGFPL